MSWANSDAAPSVALPTPRELFSRRSESRPSSLTLYVLGPHPTRWSIDPCRGPLPANTDGDEQAIRKCVRVQLIKNGKKVTAFGMTTPIPRPRAVLFEDGNL